MLETDLQTAAWELLAAGSMWERLQTLLIYLGMVGVAVAVVVGVGKMLIGSIMPIGDKSAAPKFPVQQPRARADRRKRSTPRREAADTSLLREFNLPILREKEDIAREMGISVDQLTWLTLWWCGDPIPHYTIKEIPKRSGGTREIAAPRPHMKKAQRWILREILTKLPTENEAHGFKKSRSIATNAARHAGAEIVVNLDLCDFFPTITFRRARGVFSKMGYSWEIATMLTELCVYRPDSWKNGMPPLPQLPQGAPTSPALSNLVCRRLDRRLAGLARQFGATYTRFADDIAFSGDRQFELRLSRFFLLAHKIIRREGFRVNWPKRRIRRKGARQQICGVVVNRRPTLPREERRVLRAMVHRLKTTGAIGAPDNVSDPIAWLRGQLAFYKMVDPEAGGKLYDEFQAAAKS